MIITRDNNQEGTICFWNEYDGIKLEKRSDWGGGWVWATGEDEEGWSPILCEFDIVTFKQLFPNTNLIRKGTKKRVDCSITPDESSLVVMTRGNNSFGTNYITFWYLKDASRLTMDDNGGVWHGEAYSCLLLQFDCIYFKWIFLNTPLPRKGSKQRVTLTCKIL